MHSTLARTIPLDPNGWSRDYVEFHVSRESRDRYEIEDALFTKRGHIVSADFPAAQRLAQRVNRLRRADLYPEQRITGAEIYVLGLIHEIFHHIIHRYLSDNDLSLFSELRQSLEDSLGEEKLEHTLKDFVSSFPPSAVYRGDISAEDYLSGNIDGSPVAETAQEELLLLWVLNRNPAVERYRELFDDAELAARSSYHECMAQSYLFFQRLPGVAGGNLNLIEFLRAPAHAVPEDLMGQLEYIRDYWGDLIGEWAQKILTGIDLLREENRPRFGVGGPGPAYELTFGGLQQEVEQFSEDTDWMPKVVLIAKSTFVWLDQLSREYRRSINRLDEIPDAELDRLADMGFTSLWLIGLWERSTASKVIKRSCGNPEAEASAYSLKRYEIAEELGGWEALANLRERAWMRGIRMASDMVPNHTGIDGDWVYDHPEWFLQLPQPPYPSYTYNSQNLSEHPGVGIYLEDHYYDRTDAALTFKRVQFDSGDTRYIYHGNDGTSMPWNDTAQLDYLNPDTRETIIQTIIHVAKNFPVIRFDAAMTLAKKHIHRLWYPSPGHGGDIPGRSLHGLSEEDFDRRMPTEFWREVVDRVAEEAPDTLLLAEAFWMMEGYFVRSLGMHRVYNSAFMNMLKTEDNEKYKNTVKNTISFEPEILKRFVNFMNNPDEETAIAQFGAEEKYIGVCTLMVTMPGLPMFGHGQIEGFREKYGMEYRRAYWDETPNRQLIEAHYRYIFPLMKRRHLFSGVHNFLLYDLYREDGHEDHNVFAYSNRCGSERALMLYNNAYPSVTGYIHTSAPYAEKGADGSRNILQKSLREGLDLRGGADDFLIFREQRSGLQYIRKSEEIAHNGLFVTLRGFESQVYLDLYEAHDEYGLYRNIYEHLAGRGIPDLERAKKELYLKPAHTEFRRLLREETVSRISYLLSQGAEAPGAGSTGNTSTGSTGVTGKTAGSTKSAGRPKKLDRNSLIPEESSPEKIYRRFLESCIELGYGSSERIDAAVELFEKRLDALLSLRKKEDAYHRKGLEIMPEAPVVLLSWLMLNPLENFLPENSSYSGGASLAEDLLLPEQFFPLLDTHGATENDHPRLLTLMLALSELTSHLEYRFPTTSQENSRKESSSAMLEAFVRLPYASRHLQINRHLDVEWFRGESLQEIIWWINLLAGVLAEQPTRFPPVARWLKAEEQAEYRLEPLLDKA